MQAQRGLQAMRGAGNYRPGGHADLDPGAGDADGAHDQPHPVLLPGEPTLDLGADLGTPGIGLSDPLRQRSPRLEPLVDIAGEHAPGEECLILLRSISSIGPNARGGVLLADQIRQSLSTAL